VPAYVDPATCQGLEHRKLPVPQAGGNGDGRSGGWDGGVGAFMISEVKGSTELSLPPTGPLTGTSLHVVPLAGFSIRVLGVTGQPEPDIHLRASARRLHRSRSGGEATGCSSARWR
jgi:hypothetical protein